MTDKRLLIGGAVAKGTLIVPKLVTTIGPGGLPVTRIEYVPVYVVAPVFGWPIELNPVEHDIMEGAIVTNLNFHCASRQPPVTTASELPGPMAMGV